VTVHTHLRAARRIPQWLLFEDFGCDGVWVLEGGREDDDNWAGKGCRGGNEGARGVDKGE
jgi:hypothetical protein